MFCISPSVCLSVTLLGTLSTRVLIFLFYQIYRERLLCWMKQDYFSFWMSSVKFQGHTGQIWGLLTFSGEYMEGMSYPDIWHADVSWPPSEQIWFWAWSVHFPNFFIQFKLNEMGQVFSFQAFPTEHMKRMACHLACLCILTTFITDYILIVVLIFVVSIPCLQDWPLVAKGCNRY